MKLIRNTLQALKKQVAQIAALKNRVAILDKYKTIKKSIRYEKLWETIN